MKNCRKCGLEKPLNDFYKGHGSCKCCTQKQYKDYRNRNKDAVLEAKKAYYTKNKAKCLYSSSKRYNLNKKLITSQQIQKRLENPTYRRKCHLRSRLSAALRRYINDIPCVSSAPLWTVLNCTRETLVLHIESKFTAGMSWENYGRRGWELDHIIPLSSAGSVQEVDLLFHYKNLQPLWKKDNLAKFNKNLF